MMGSSSTRNISGAWLSVSGSRTSRAVRRVRMATGIHIAETRRFLVSLGDPGETWRGLRTSAGRTATTGTWARSCASQADTRAASVTLQTLQVRHRAAALHVEAQQPPRPVAGIVDAD